MSQPDTQERRVIPRSGPTAFIVDLQLPDLFEDEPTIEQLMEITNIPVETLEEGRELIRRRISELGYEVHRIDPWSSEEFPDEPPEGYREHEAWAVTYTDGLEVDAGRIRVKIRGDDVIAEMLAGD